MTELNMQFWVGFVIGFMLCVAIYGSTSYCAERTVRKRLARMKGKYDADYIVREREAHDRFRSDIREHRKNGGLTDVEAQEKRLYEFAVKK